MVYVAALLSKTYRPIAKEESLEEYLHRVVSPNEELEHAISSYVTQVMMLCPEHTLQCLQALIGFSANG